MCGICGVWYFNPEHSVNLALITAMSDQIVHRGPDEPGIHLERSIGLGFRRLSIIDVAGSHQPMSNTEQTAWIVFNGEIYNFKDLRESLATHHTFRTSGDTETILHAYEDYGTACVQHLRGMFAFAIWDRPANRLTMAVDRFGKKPLYYLLDNEKIVFASEIKSILQHPNVSREIDFEALDQYLSCGYIAAPHTIFRAVRKLPPGHTLTIDNNGQAQLHEYWHPRLCEPSEYDKRSVDDLATELRELLTDSVRLRMISDVPLGAFLSGGVDSSAIVALMSRVSTAPIKTFSIGFDESFYDETSYAKIVADYCKTDHTSEVVRPDIVSVLPKLIHQFDEPFADASMIPTYWVSQAARQHVTVALSGDGGDEVFGGYQTYRFGYRHKLLQAIIPASLRPTTAQIARKIPLPSRVRRYLSIITEPVQYWGIHNDYFTPSQRGELFTSDAAAHLGGYVGEKIKRDIFASARNLNWLSQLQYNDLRTYMPDDILVKVDHASMLASLEVRCPLLDHVVFEFMAKVPPKYKMSLWDSKVLLKKALGDLLPPAIHHRNKRGFTIPLSEWLSGPLQPLLRDSLLNPNAYSRNYFNRVVVSRLIDEHMSGQADHKARLWALLCFELWACEYLS